MPETFADLPDALVRDLIARAEPVAEEIRVRVQRLRDSQAELRRAALQLSLVRRKADLDVPREPSVAGVDGSYQVHRLTSLDLCAAAAVAVEGTSKEATRHWPEPYHKIWTDGVPHSQGTTNGLRAVMVSMEITLGSDAPHDLVLLDGSFRSLIIYLNQGLANVSAVPARLSGEIRRVWQEDGVLQKLLGLMQSPRVAAVPKYTSQNELVTAGGLVVEDGIDGRTLATLVLEPGEYTSPQPLHEEAPGEDGGAYHLPREFCSALDVQSINSAMGAMRAVYYRPYGWVPALRLEVPGPIANSQTRLSILLEGIARQFFSPAVVEPYPLFLADRMVKSLGAGVSVVEQTMAQHVADRGVDVELTMLCLQNYRTEGGRGGV